MLEPLIVLTALNCIFMFSSTVTTCVLWWQYQNQRCCVKRNFTQRKSDLKRSKSNYAFRTTKKPGKSELNADVNVVNKSSTNAGREHKNKRYQGKKSKKSLRYLAEYQKKREEKMSFPGRIDASKLEERTKMSEASQTVSNAKSTVVMEFSTVQKVMQIVDNDPSVNSTRAHFKDIVVQKDMANKKYDCNTEQNFTTNVAATENT